MNRPAPQAAIFISGRTLLQQGQPREALPLLQAALDAAPDNIAVLHAYTSCLEQLGRFTAMRDTYAAAVARTPGDASLLAGLGRAWLQEGDREQARACLQRAWQIAPTRPVAAGQYGRLLREDGEADAACEVLQPAIAAHPGLADLQWEYAQSLLACDRLDEAFACFAAVRQLRPGDPSTEVAFGRIAAAKGAREAAQAYFRAALAIDRTHAPAWWELAHACRTGLAPEERDAVAAALTRRLPAFHQALLEDVLARDCDRRADYVAASAHAQHANAHHSGVRAASGLIYQPQQHTHEVDATIAIFDAGLLRRLADAGVASDRPVFVFGLPRSGTTLVEQMLGAHPQAVGIGEQVLARHGLQQALDASRRAGSATLTPAAIQAAANRHLHTLEQRRLRLAPERPGLRVIDKLPDNYLLAGWLALAFPQATLIHCRRDPRDVALSCWLAQFAQLGWSFDLQHIAHRIEQHQRLMRHWRGVLGARLVEVDYETLVVQPETEARRLVVAMRLDWHPDVLDFNTRRSVVRSASQMQVREPVNRRAVGRWRNYSAVLAPVMPRLEAVLGADRDPTRPIP